VGVVGHIMLSFDFGIQRGHRMQDSSRWVWDDVMVIRCRFEKAAGSRSISTVVN
jgi:hypothetical protein